MAGIEFYDFYDDHGIGIHILQIALITKKMHVRKGLKEGGMAVKSQKGIENLE